MKMEQLRQKGACFLFFAESLMRHEMMSTLAISGHFPTKCIRHCFLHDVQVLLLRALKVRSCMCLLTAELIIFVSIGADFN